MNNQAPHSFHIPVLGIGYSIDTPAKVAHLGISSVISLLDDMLMEKMREFYSEKFDLPFQAISEKIEDFRAKRITAYLNLIDKIARDKFDEVKASFQQKSSEFHKYMELLPDSSQLKVKFEEMTKNWSIKEVKEWIHENLSMGNIDVNIMTKVDKENYIGNEQLPIEYNDAHAALRGFAKSRLQSSVVLSAGMSPRLYSYLESFEEFYPDARMHLKKKITLKVSDYRSALIQGKYLAKKGLWVSEYRVESGLNCGGHAFPSAGYLLGPILEEFKINRESLIRETHAIYMAGLKLKGRQVPEQPMPIKITAQGGVGTSTEHNFMADHYELDSVGWGTPFLLVPEVVNVDEHTLDLLKNATEKDLYLSDISPLGVPFNNLRGNTKDIEKEVYISEGKPGNPCSKTYAALSHEFSEKPLCTASRKYQRLKIKELDTFGLKGAEYKEAYDKIVEKSCICVGLGTSALLVNNLDTRTEKEGVSICPGPNMAYFGEVMTLKQMVDHIYGRINVIKRNDRPHMFIKELKLYIDYLKNKLEETDQPYSDKQSEYFITFRDNLNQGVAYYKTLFAGLKEKFGTMRTKLLADLNGLETELKQLAVPEVCMSHA